MKNQLKFEIADQACILAGLDPIGNLMADKSERAKACRQFIDDVITTGLETLNYEFAQISAPLTKMSDGDGYQLPPHYIKLIGLCGCTCNDCSGGEMTLNIDKDVRFHILNNRLYVNTPCSICNSVDSRNLVYSALEHNMTEIPSTLKQAISHLLAYYVARRMGTERDPLELYKMYGALIAQAKKTNESNHHLNSDLGSTIQTPFYYGTGRGRLF